MQICHLFVHLFIQQLIIEPYYVPGFGDREVNKIDVVPCSRNSQTRFRKEAVRE